MKIVDINTLKGSDRHGSCTECEKDFAEDKGMKRIVFGTDQKRTIFLCDKCYHDFLQEMNKRNKEKNACIVVQCENCERIHCILENGEMEKNACNVEGGPFWILGDAVVLENEVNTIEQK